MKSKQPKTGKKTKYTYMINLVAVTFCGGKKVKERVVKRNIKTEADWDLVEMFIDPPNVLS